VISSTTRQLLLRYSLANSSTSSRVRCVCASSTYARRPLSQQAENHIAHTVDQLFGVQHIGGNYNVDVVRRAPPTRRRCSAPCRAARSATRHCTAHSRATPCCVVHFATLAAHNRSASPRGNVAASAARPSAVPQPSSNRCKPVNSATRAMNEYSKSRMPASHIARPVVEMTLALVRTTNRSPEANFVHYGNNTMHLCHWPRLPLLANRRRAAPHIARHRQWTRCA
jgi:hypothetical protein